MTSPAALAIANGLPEPTLRPALAACCGSSRFVAALAASRPWASATDLHETADRVAAELDRTDWLEAFDHHPRIGDIAALRVRFANPTSQSWSRGEQAGLAGVDEAILERFATANLTYEARFGHIFIVCASGKSAAEMLALLEARLDNPPGAELAVAAREQLAITHLRLDKWLRELDPETSP